MSVKRLKRRDKKRRFNKRATRKTGDMFTPRNGSFFSILMSWLGNWANVVLPTDQKKEAIEPPARADAWSWTPRPNGGRNRHGRHGTRKHCSAKPRKRARCVAKRRAS